MSEHQILGVCFDPQFNYQIMTIKYFDFSKNHKFSYISLSQHPSCPYLTIIIWFNCMAIHIPDLPICDRPIDFLKSLKSLYSFCRKANAVFCRPKNLCYYLIYFIVFLVLGRKVELNVWRELFRFYGMPILCFACGFALCKQCFIQQHAAAMFAILVRSFTTTASPHWKGMNG